MKPSTPILPGLNPAVVIDTMRQLGASSWRLVSGGEVATFSEKTSRTMTAWLVKHQAERQSVLFLPPMIEGAHWFITARLPLTARPAECSPLPQFIVRSDDYTLLWRVSAPVGEAQAKTIAARLVERMGGQPATGQPIPLPGTIHAVEFAPRLVKQFPVMLMRPARTQGYIVEGDRLTVEYECTSSPFTDADTVEAKPIEWLWPNLVPLGCLTLLGGAPGMGKSQAAISMAAIISKGSEWPGGVPGERGSALVLESEDDLARVITPRLIAAGADLRRVGLGKRIDLSEGIGALEAERNRRKDLRLVVLSPVREFFGEAVEARGNLAVREAMKPLLTWAENHGIAVVGVAHPPKGKEEKEAFAGSNAFLEVARAAYSVIPDPESDEPILKRKPRLLVSAKSNLSADDVRIGYHIEGAEVGDIKTSRVVWG